LSALPISFETVLKVLLSWLPRAPIAVIAATGMRAAIRPYSMAVAPCSSRSSLLMNFMVVSWFSLRYPA
jgi:hypothetical protein